MGKGRVAIAAIMAVATLGALGTAVSPLAAQHRERINPFAMGLLEEHNRARADVGVPRLEWSNRLAREAHEWAQHLARQGILIIVLVLVLVRVLILVPVLMLVELILHRFTI